MSKAKQSMKIIKLGNTMANLEQQYDDEAKKEPLPLRKFSNDTLHQFTHYLGTCIFAISVVAFIGHILKLFRVDAELFYRWVGDVGMAFNTSIVIMIISLILLLHETRIGRHERKV